MRKLLIPLFCFFVLSYISSSSANMMLIHAGADAPSGADWSDVTMFLNFEGTFDDGSDTYTMAASEYSSTSITEAGEPGAGETVDVTSGCAKIGGYGLFATSNYDYLQFDGTDLTEDEGGIGFWVKMTSWDDGQKMIQLTGTGNDEINVIQESDDTNEFCFTFRANSGSWEVDCSTGSSLSTGTWYFIEWSWKESTDYYRITFSTDASQDFFDWEPTAGPDQFDAAPSTDDLWIGITNQYGVADQCIDNFIATSSSTKDLYPLRNETSH